MGRDATVAGLPRKNVYRQVVKGRSYYRFRRSGCPDVRLPGEPGTPQFEAAYSSLAMAGTSDPDVRLNAITKYAVAEALKRARNRAKASAIPFDLSPAYISDMMRAQMCACAVSGIQFDLGRSGVRQGKTRLPFRPSIDKLDPALGYVRGNVRVVCFAVNMALSDWGDDVFLEVCRATVKNHASGQGVK